MIGIMLAIDEIQDEDERALVGKIYDEYALKIKALAFHILGNKQDAEEALGDTFVKIIRHRHRFADATPEEIKRLVIIFTRSAGFDISKRRKKMKEILTDNLYINEEGEDSIGSMADEWDVLQDYINKETVHRVSEMIEAMPTPTKEIMQLRFNYQEKTSEIADILGMNHSTVRSIIQRTVLQIKTKIEESEYEYK